MLTPSEMKALEILLYGKPIPDMSNRERSSWGLDEHWPWGKSPLTNVSCGHSPDSKPCQMCDAERTGC